MPLYLIRCATAAKRRDWDGPDEDRPLTTVGRAQADALADWLGRQPIAHVLSSPSLRCVQTVTPLARRRDLEVEELSSLAPSHDVQLVLAWIRALPEHSVLCSHGSLITRVMEILTRQGAEIAGTPDWRKGVTWVLQRRDHHVVGTYTVPPRAELTTV
jgi:phosphohistidine phosphatase SixA